MMFLKVSSMKYFRKKKLLSQKQLADAIGVTRSVISKYENGKITPSLDKLQKISEALEIPVRLLINDNDCFEVEAESEGQQNVLQAAIATYGKQSQLTVAMEEMAELTKELSKNIRGNDNISDIAEETADVLIMLDQIQMIFGNRRQVEDFHRQKIRRLANRLDKEKEGEKDVF